MTTVANSTNSYTKRLEVLQIGTHQSKCTLLSEFLKKAENYTLQIEKFVVNITPPINTITDPYIELFARPDVGVVGIETVANLSNDTNAIVNRTFQPDNPKSTLDVLFEIKRFCDLHPGLTLKINANQELLLEMSLAFGSTTYLKLHPFVAKLLNVAEYLYYFEDNTGVIRTADRTQEYPDLFYSPAELAAPPINHADTPANNKFRQSAAVLQVLPDLLYDSQPVTKLDTRMSLDVTSTIGSDSKIIILDEVERQRKLIGRFPIGEAITNYNEGGDEVSQIINVGLEDMCRNNPDTQTINLHTGDILVVNTYIEARYLEDGKIITQDANFEQSGFFYLQLLFTKRLK